MKKRNCTIRVAKTKALISFKVTTKLICVYDFAYADYWFSCAVAHFILLCSYVLPTAKVIKRWNLGWFKDSSKILEKLEFVFYVKTDVSPLSTCMSKTNMQARVIVLVHHTGPDLEPNPPPPPPPTPCKTYF